MKSNYRTRILAASAGVLMATTANAATIVVNSGGNLQSALNQAAPGDVILLQAGATFVGNFVLPEKPGSGPAITIRSSAADSILPGPGQRIRPSVHAAHLPKLRSPNSTPALQTAARARFWTLRFLEFQANQGGYGDIIALGSGDPAVQNALSQVPSDIVIDRSYIHGDPAIGQKRGIALNSGNTAITNSHISDIKTSGFDSQAIAGWNGPGPYLISNNYLEASTENVLIGGADPGIANLVPSNITFTQNHLAKPVSWRDPIVSAPAGLTGQGTTGGSLAKGTYSYTVVAARKVALDQWVFSGPSVSISVAVTSPKGAVSLSWTADPLPTVYRVYRLSDRPNVRSGYFETSVPSFQDVGARPPSSGPSPGAGRWLVKNLFELKNAQDVLVDGNIMEHNWTHGQVGYAILLTPRNQDGTAPWSVVQRVTLTNNIVRHAAGGINILGSDNEHPSRLTNTITIRNNLFDDLGGNGAWGEDQPWILMGAGGDRFTIDHNTVIHTGASLVYFYGAQTFTNFSYTNNMGRHNVYGFIGENRGPGNDTIDAFLAAPYTLAKSVIVDAPPQGYPATNQNCGLVSCFPTEAAWRSDFESFGTGNYRLRAGTPYKGAGTDGGDLGVNVDLLPPASVVSVP